MKQKNTSFQRPMVSVILPVFNAEKYLSESIDSILAQTFADFELLALDDGSVDGSLKILQQYAQRDTRVRIIARENRGLSETLNELIKLSRGIWIARMDADDISLPNRLERQLAWLAETGADMTGSWIQRFGTIDQRLVCPHESNDVLKLELLFGCPFRHPTVLMRRTLAALFYNKNFDWAEDYDLWIRAVGKKFRMTNVPEVLLLYRNHQGQISSKLKEKQFKLTQEIRKRHWKFMAKQLDIEASSIDAIMTMFAEKFKNINIESIDESFVKVLRHCPPNGRAVIFAHITNLYLKNVAYSYEIMKKWKEMNREFGISSGFLVMFYFRLFFFLKIRPEGNLFKLMKKVYLVLFFCKNLPLRKKNFHFQKNLHG